MFKFKRIEDGTINQSKEDSIYLSNEYNTHFKAIGFSHEHYEKYKEEEE